MKYGDRPGEQRPQPPEQLPSYQEGGTVPQDQTAQLDEGEYVLDPKDAALWKQAEEQVKHEYNVGPNEMKAEGVDTPTMNREGQTVSFGGEKTIPNPKDIKPMLDTDQPAPTLDYKVDDKGMMAGGAKMNIDNAPINRQVHQFPSGVPMSIENTPISEPGDIGMVDPKAQAAAAQMQEISAKTPVIEKPLANGTTDQPGGTAGYTPQMGKPNSMMGAGEQPGALEAAMQKQRGGVAQPETEQEKQIKEDLKVNNEDLYEAMKSGNLHDMGMAKLNERMLKSALPLPQPTDIDNGPPSARENIVNQKAAARNKMINGQTLQERYQGEQELAQLNRVTPMGSEGSRFPGMGGKILHALGGVGQAALMGTAPYLLPAIPGSQANIAGHEARGAQGVAEEQKKTEQAQKIAAGPAEQAFKEAQAKREAEIPLEQQMIQSYDALEKAEAAKDPAQIESANQRIEHLQAVKNAMIGDEGKRPVGDAGVTQQQQQLDTMTAGMLPDESKKFKEAFAVGPKDTHAIATKRLEDAKASAALSGGERDRALQRGIATKNHEDNMVAREDARQDRLRGKFYTYTDSEGTHLAQGNQLPEGAKDELAIQNPQQFLAEARSSNIVQESLNKVYEDVEKHPEIFDNAASRAILATTLEQMDRQSAALLVAGTGGSIPLPSGLGDIINTQLQNKSLDKSLAEALKTYIADYKNMKDKAIIMQMDMQGGKIGRASQVALNAIINQIPNGSTPDSKRAMQQLGNMQAQQTGLMGSYPEKYQDFTKAKPYTPGKGAGTAATNLQAGHTVTQGGKNFIIDEVDKSGKATKWHPAP